MSDSANGPVTVMDTSEQGAPRPDHPLTYSEFTCLVEIELTKYGSAYTKQLFEELLRRKLIDEESFKTHATTN